MQRNRQTIDTVTPYEFIRHIAKDLIEHAANNEGITSWINTHGGTVSMPDKATRSYAYSLYGDSDEASVLNAFLALEIQQKTSL